MTENLQVAIRIRPILRSEIGKEEVVDSNVFFKQGNQITVHDSTHLIQSHYDQVFNSTQNQQDVYQFVAPVIDTVSHGFNTSIFAYGQTGSGKTFTMFGSNWEQNNQRRRLNQHTLDRPETHGIIPRSIEQLFNRLAFEGDNYTVLCSFLQIYNEKIYDLLQDKDLVRPLNVREDSTFGIYVENLTEYVIQNKGECFQLVKRGDRNRAVRSTRMNIMSSRSHSIFQLVVESNKPNKKGFLNRAKLNLCDLAGSEKFEKTGQMSNIHISELKNINLSLSCLGKVISALAQPQKRSHVPYRESRLTRLLQDSIGGNTRTFFIATVSPIRECIEETISTLKFADRAKQVMVRVEKNTISATNDKLVNKLQREIAYLRDILHMRRQGGDGIKEIQNKLIILQEENAKLREITREISYDEVEKLKRENKDLRIQLQELQNSAAFSGVSTGYTQSEAPKQNHDGDICSICGESLPCNHQPISQEMTRSREPSKTQRPRSLPRQRPIEVRVRGKGNVITKRIGSVVRSFDDLAKDRQLKQDVMRQVQKRIEANKQAIKEQRVRIVDDNIRNIILSTKIPQLQDDKPTRRHYFQRQRMQPDEINMLTKVPLEVVRERRPKNSKNR